RRHALARMAQRQAISHRVLSCLSTECTTLTDSHKEDNMNPAFELTEEETVEDKPVVTFPVFPPLPENPDPATAEQILSVYEETIAALPTISKHTLEAYGDAIEQIKLAENGMEERRKAKVGPLNKEVKEINEAYMPFVKRFELMWRRLSEVPNRFIAEQRRLADEEQRRANAIAEQKRLEEERKAQADRDAAAKALEAGNLKEAAKLESRADQHELRAASTVAPIIDQVSKKVDTGTSYVGFSGGKKTWALPGWDKESKLYADSPLLAGVDMDWLKRFCVVDPVRLNAAYKAGDVLPKPFAETMDYAGATSRGKK
ncbi:MAG: hypothetical protein ABIU97_01160, partial [Dehalococcoidia bacterium]